MSSQPGTADELGQAIAFRDLLTALRRHWVLLAATTVLAALGGALAATVLPPTYEASATMLVEATVVDRTDPEARNDLVSPELEIQLVRSSDVLFDAARQVDPPADPEALRRNLVVTNVDGTDLLVLSVTASNADRALLLLEAVSTSYLDQRRERALDEVRLRVDSVSTRLRAVDRGIAEVNNEIADLADDPGQTDGQRVLLESQRELLAGQLVSLQQQQAQFELLNTDPGRLTERPRITSDGGVGPLLIAIGATAFGLVLGVGLALLRDRTDDRLWGVADIERVVPDIPVVLVDHAELVEEGFLEAPAYRELRDLVISFPVPSPTTLVLLSPRTDGAVGWVATGVAAAISRAGLDTVLLDPNGMEGVEQAAGWAGLPPDTPGRLDDYLFKDVPLSRAAVATTRRPNLRVLQRSRNALDRDVTVAPRLRSLLGRQPSRETIADEAVEQLSVAVAGPGIIDSPDGAVLGGMGDSVLLVCRSRVTTRDDLTRSLRSLRTHAAALVAVVLVPTGAPGDL